MDDLRLQHLQVNVIVAKVVLISSGRLVRHLSLYNCGSLAV